MATPYRADQVGSLLRPAEVLEARVAYAEGRIELARLREVEDQAILDALEMQRQVGIDIFTDGEMRRDAWMSNLAVAVDGFIDEHQIRHWHTLDGSMEDEPSRAKIAAAKLRQVRRLTAHDVSFLQQHAPGPFKITMPSPVTISYSSYKAGVTDKVYPTRAQFLEDLVAIMQGELQLLAQEGVSYMQLDEGFSGYVGEEWEGQLQRLGLEATKMLEADIAAENACYDALPRDQVVLAIHICRGNSKSRWGRSPPSRWQGRGHAGPTRALPRSLPTPKSSRRHRHLRPRHCPPSPSRHRGTASAVAPAFRVSCRGADVRRARQ